MFRSGRPRGIYFISTLVVGILIAMLVSSGLLIARSSLGGSIHFAGGHEALQAAESGLRYAQARLGDDPAWRAEISKVVQTPDGSLVVVEEQGNVIGLIRAEDGSYSQFRIRFNWQDDVHGNREGIGDPSDEMWIDHPYISINNITGGSEYPVPRGDGPDHSVDDPDDIPYKVPAGTACILVEGRTGPGLADLSPTNINPPVSGQGSVTRRVVESYLRVGGLPNADAAAMAADDITVDLNDGDVFEVKAKSGLPRIRSKQEVRVEGGDLPNDNYVSPNGEVYADSKRFFAKYDKSQVKPVDESLEGGDFYKLEWDDVTKADPAGQTLKAGTYVLWEDGLHYYDMNYNDYVQFIEKDPTNPGLYPVDIDSDVAELKGKTLEITGDLYIEPNGDVDEFTLIPRRGAMENPENEVTGGDLGEQAEEVTLIASGWDEVPDPADSWWQVQWNIPDAPNKTIDIKCYNPDGTGLGGTNVTFGLKLDNGVLTLFDEYQADFNGEITDTFKYFIQPPANGTIAQFQSDPNFPQVQEQFQELLLALGASGDSMRELNLPGVPEEELKTKPDDIKVEFKPEGGEAAILSSEGTVRIGSRVEGTGGSITSGGDIRIVGTGSNLTASVEEGLNLYGKGDIVLSSLLPKDNGEYDYKTFDMRGVIYAWGDFEAKIGYHRDKVKNWGEFILAGALVAYGGDPAGDPGNEGNGKIEIKAKKVALEFDPAYLVALQNSPSPGPMRETFHQVR